MSNNPSSLWSPIDLNQNCLHLMKLIESDNSIDMWLTNLSHIWHSHDTPREIMEISKIKNTHIETTVEIIRKKLMERPQQMIIDEGNSVPGQLTIVAKYYLEKMPFYYSWNLKNCINDEMLQEVTKPLMQQLAYSTTANKELVKIIQKKDLEINEYKLQNVKIMRTGISTNPFNPGEFWKQFKDQNCFVDMDENKYVLSNKLQLSMEYNTINQEVIPSPQKRSIDNNSVSLSIGIKRPRRPRKQISQREKPTSVKYNQATDSSSDDS